MSTRHVETSIPVAASADAIVRAFLDVEAMRRWWGADRGLVIPREGGVWSLAWERSEHGFKYVTTGRVEVFDPGRRLTIGNVVYFNPERMVLGPMSLTVTTTPLADHHIMTIRQAGYREGGDWDWYYETVRNAWPEVAKSIKRHLELEAAAPSSERM